jgi:hypothetical protein
MRNEFAGSPNKRKVEGRALSRPGSDVDDTEVVPPRVALQFERLFDELGLLDFVER